MPDTPRPTAGQDAAPEPRLDARAYWAANVRAVTALMLIWAIVSLGFGVLLVEPLNRIRLPGSGFPLGFWFAQQGSIYTFVVLIFVYVRVMRRLDRRFGVEEQDAPPHNTTGDGA